jgi:hypothetical protein
MTNLGVLRTRHRMVLNGLPTPAGRRLNAFKVTRRRRWLSSRRPATVALPSRRNGRRPRGEPRRPVLTGRAASPPWGGSRSWPFLLRQFSRRLSRSRFSTPSQTRWTSTPICPLAGSRMPTTRRTVAFTASTCGSRLRPSRHRGVDPAASRGKGCRGTRHRPVTSRRARIFDNRSSPAGSLAALRQLQARRQEDGPASSRDDPGRDQTVQPSSCVDVCA